MLLHQGMVHTKSKVEANFQFDVTLQNLPSTTTIMVNVF